MELKEVSVLSIRLPNRKEHSIRELVKSIKENGLITPILLRKLKRSSGTHMYELIDGLLRIRAFKSLGKTTIAAYVKEPNQS